LSWTVTFSPLARIPVLSAPEEMKPWTTTLSALTSMPGTVAEPPPE
jgi:hypothetical protein